MRNIMKKCVNLFSILVMFIAILICPITSVFAESAVYRSSHDGYGGEVTVSLEIDGDEIIGIDIVGPDETPDIGGKAIEQLESAILTQQSIQVEAISGATKTSDAVKIAAIKALEDNGIDPSKFTQNDEKPLGEDEEISTQVVVVGSGGAGTAAALTVAEAGYDVVVLEKNGFVGGNTKISSGFFAVDTSFQEEAGVETSVEEAINQILPYHHYVSNGPLTREIIIQSGPTVEWLDSLGMSITLQGKSGQQAHGDDPYKALSYHTYDNTEEGFDNLYQYFEELGGQLLLNTRMTDIIEEDGHAVGVVAEKSDGSSLTVKSDAVMIATGGYGGDSQRVSQKSGTDLMVSLGVPNIGDGIDAMEELGAVDIDSTPMLHGSQLAESKVTHDSSQDTLAGYSTSPLTQLLMSPLLWVNDEGVRFVNEDVIYDTAYWAQAAYSANGRYYIVVDQATLDDYSKGSDMELSFAGPGPNTDSGDFTALAEEAVQLGTAFKGETIEELAQEAGMNIGKFTKTIEDYNDVIKNDFDDVYGKRAESLKYSVETGPYYAFECRAVYLGTIGGVRVNEDLQVLDNEMNLIEGLYTGGADAGGYYHGEIYPPYEGMASGFSWTSGRIAGQSIVKYLNN